MARAEEQKSVLIFAYGNASRGDDALAPLLLKRIQQLPLLQACGYPLKFLQDYQMQVEHVMDMQACERVLLIDASESQQQPVDFYSVQEHAESCYTTHGMSAANLLHTYRQVHHTPAPLTCMLAIQGLQFELGQSLSPKAEKNLQIAFEFLTKLLLCNDFYQWDLSMARPEPQLVVTAR